MVYAGSAGLRNGPKRIKSNHVEMDCHRVLRIRRILELSFDTFPKIYSSTEPEKGSNIYYPITLSLDNK